MERITLPFMLVLLFVAQTAQAQFRPLGRYYKLVPESQSHTMSGSASATALSKDSIKVFVWNIKKAMMVDWQNEFESYGQNKDIYMIQEAYESPIFVQTLSTFKDVRWDFGISFLYAIYSNQATGNMIGSPVAPTEILMKHTPDYEPVVETPKSTAFGKYPVNGSDKKLLVISVHGINLTKFSAFARHMDQIEGEIAKHDGPIIFAGDFNTRTQGRMNYLMSMTKRLGFKTVNFKFGEYRMRFKGTPHYLDHGFVRGLTVKNAEVLKDSDGSDHKPLSLELAIAE